MAEGIVGGDEVPAVAAGLHIFGEEDTRFVLEDFSTCRIADNEQARQIFGEAQAHAGRGDSETNEDLLAKAYDLVPAIRLVLTIEYTEDDDLASLTGVILDGCLRGGACSIVWPASRRPSLGVWVLPEGLRDHRVLRGDLELVAAIDR